MCGIERDDSYLSPHSNIHLLQPPSQVQLRRCCNSQGTPHRIWKSRSLSSRSLFRSLISGLEPAGNRCPAPRFLSFRMLQAVIRGELGPGSLELFFERLGSSHPRYLCPNSKPCRDLLTGIAPGGFESSGTAIPEGRRPRPDAVLTHLPSDCHRPRAIAGEGAQALAGVASCSRQRQSRPYSPDLTAWSRRITPV